MGDDAMLKIEVLVSGVITQKACPAIMSLAVRGLSARTYHDKRKRMTSDLTSRPS